MLTKTDSAFYFQAGTIPVIVTVPHAAVLQTSFGQHLRERKAEQSVKRHEVQLIPFTSSFMKRLTSLWGSPYILIPQVHRSRIDFARQKSYLNGERAYDDPQAEAIYDGFEQFLTKITQEVTEKSQRSLLLDLHGCRTDEYDVFLGTLNGKTTSSVNGKSFGKDHIRAYLENKNWRISPLAGLPETRFMGRPDSIISRFNLAEAAGENASLQLEISKAIRTVPKRNRQLACDLADAVHSVFTSYSKD